MAASTASNGEPAGAERPVRVLCLGNDLIGGSMGALIGAVIGSAFESGRWVKVGHPQRPVSIGIAPAGRGVEATVTLRF